MTPFGTFLGAGGINAFCDPSCTKTQLLRSRVTRFRTFFANVFPHRCLIAFLCVFVRLLSFLGPFGCQVGSFGHFFAYFLEVAFRAVFLLDFGQGSAEWMDYTFKCILFAYKCVKTCFI